MVTSFFNLREYESMDMYACMYVRPKFKVRACEYDREQHLRRDDHRRQGREVLESIARYGHQGGGQRQAGQGRVS